MEVDRGRVMFKINPASRLLLADGGSLVLITGVSVPLAGVLGTLKFLAEYLLLIKLFISLGVGTGRNI